MASIPDMEVDRERLNQIDGAMPRLNAIPKGCAFNPRCTHAFDKCTQERPELTQVTKFDQSGQTHVACWLQTEVRAEGVR
jgi:peptide/nickel transport system ATP-binding protein